VPYKHREPVPERVMDRKIYEGENTLCQTIRDMYHMTSNQDIRLKCRLAMAMGKAMCEKLSKYKEKYGLGNPEYQDGI
jgi:hypothetical protein